MYLIKGYYRVQYDNVLTTKIQDQLELDHEIIALGSRTQFFDDYFTFAFDGNTMLQNMYVKTNTKYFTITTNRSD
jgi:hypothetical protein